MDAMDGFVFLACCWVVSFIFCALYTAARKGEGE